MFLRFVWLPELEADVLSEELLVPDENDDPSEITEFGRRVDLISGNVPEKELRNFGAINKTMQIQLYEL